MSNPLLDLIVQGESGTAGYNAYNRGTYVDAHGGKHIRGPLGAIDFSSLTVGQVNDRQHLRGDDPDRLLAVGKYQVIPATMDDAILKLDLDRDQAFTPALQDRIFSEYLIVDKRPDIHGFITGQPGVTLEAAQRSLAQEWASFGDPDKGGASHYGGANHASITLAQSASALDQMRTSYQADIARGLSPAQAWKDVTASDQSPTQTHRASRANAHTLLQQGSRGDAVRTLQTELVTLGYTDAHGHPLKPDGDFGAHIRFAVEAFQRDHHLTVDGKVGPHTQSALSEALKLHQQEVTLPLTDPRHPDHRLFAQALAGVHRIDAEMGRTPDQHSKNLAAALTVAAKQHGLTRIDAVGISADGARTSILQNDSLRPRIADVATAQAVHTPMGRSSAAALTMQPAPTPPARGPAMNPELDMHRDAPTHVY